MSAKKRTSILSRVAGFFATGATAIALLTGTACEPQGPALNDSDISETIRRELRLDQAVLTDHLQVSTAEGVVTLEGTVENLLARERAQRIAETVKGVRSVVNTIRVVPPLEYADSVVAQDVERALLTDPATEAYEVTVDAEDGVVTLDGEVESLAERELAEKVAMGIRGVSQVRNNISVEWEQDRFDHEIQEEVERSLHWDVLVDDALIEVRVTEGRVMLEGIVGSAAEKRRAGYDAQVAGVDSVDLSGLQVARWARDNDLRQDKYVNVSDEDMQEAVQQAIARDPRIEDGEISITVEDGVATLQGRVHSLEARRAAGAAARNTVGVSHVENDLAVYMQPLPGDEDVGFDVQYALERDAYLQDSDISVEVTDGVVTLLGEVETPFRKAHADDVASRVEGVVGVINNLTVAGERRPYVYEPFVSTMDPRALPGYRDEPFATALSDDAIRESIEREFFWSPFVDGEDITVTVEDGVATLTGTVDSRRELEDATENAFEGGASWVENELVVVTTGGP